MKRQITRLINFHQLFPVWTLISYILEIKNSKHSTHSAVSYLILYLFIWHQK